MSPAANVSSLVPPPTAEAAPSFSSVYRAHYAGVVRWVRALGGPDMDLDDLAQEVFVIVHRQLPRFDGGNLSAWLYAITKRTVRDRRRSAWFKRLFLGSREIPLEHVESAAADPLALLEQKDAQRLFFQLADQVHASRRETFLLFEIGGFSGEEIGALQEVPIATVWTRLHLARKEFTTAVASYRREARS